MTQHPLLHNHSDATPFQANGVGGHFTANIKKLHSLWSFWHNFMADFIASGHMTVSSPLRNRNVFNRAAET